jgi:uncharacterized protein (DUF1778 family)
MGMTRDIRIKVTPLQYEIIKNKAQVNGFKTVSSFIRDAIFNESGDLLKEIHEILVNKPKSLSKSDIGMDLMDTGVEIVRVEG